MTNFEKIKETVEDNSTYDLAEFLCGFFEENCQSCPATNYCYYKHNGMLEWLNAEEGKKVGE